MSENALRRAEARHRLAYCGPGSVWMENTESEIVYAMSQTWFTRYPSELQNRIVDLKEMIAKYKDQFAPLPLEPGEPPLTPEEESRADIFVEKRALDKMIEEHLKRFHNKPLRKVKLRGKQKHPEKK